MPPEKPGSGNGEFMLPESYESDIELAIKHLQRLTGLKKLDLMECPNATDKCITQINKLPSLTILRASKTSISGKGLSELTRIKELEKLTYSEGTEVSTLLKALAGSKKLTSLKLDQPAGQTLTLSDLKLIASCKNLTRLDLDDCKLDREGLAILATLPNLKMLYASGNKLDESCLPIIKQMPSLEEVDFAAPSWTPHCQKMLRRQFPKISTIIFDE
jgi:Leucine-rich repeat (LRR) protein